MEQIVLMCGKRELDPKVVKAFLQCNSMFPIGSWVELSDGSKARVVGPDKNDYMRPIVSIIFDKNGKRIENLKKLELSLHHELRVIKALEETSVGEFSLMDGF
jgi:hypothetical protein